MLVTNHVLAGALLGGSTRRPLPAFLIGVASHFAMDAVPHWGKWRDREYFLRVAVADGLAGLTAMGALLTVARPERRAAVAAGMIGAALPDLDKPAVLWFGASPWPAAVNRFHSRIQDEAAGRFSLEAGAAAALAAAAVAALRRP
ncbi:MAG: hypothetical protein LBI49_03035 [Nocardiopsaceae bacterium]|jgi:hypothetical protein|nr:hypothetical protein [Nocardiopsaceae bacterium]